MFILKLTCRKLPMWPGELWVPAQSPGGVESLELYALSNPPEFITSSKMRRLVEVQGLLYTQILVTSLSRYQRRGELITNKIGILIGMYTHFYFRTAFASQYRTASSQRLPSFGSSPSPGRLRSRRWISERQPASYAPLQVIQTENIAFLNNLGDYGA